MYRNLKETNTQEITKIPNKPMTHGISKDKKQPEQPSNNGTTVEPPSTSIQRLSADERNKVFRLFSNAQICYQLKFCTVHLAFALYLKCRASPSSSLITDPYLKVSCLYLAMKYEQIYPPNLQQMSGYFGEKLTLSAYRLHELEVLEILGMNLSVENAAHILDQTMIGPNWKGIKRFMGFSLLEIAIVQSNIYDNYTVKQICKAISYILNITVQNSDEKQLLGKKESKKTKKLAAMLIKARPTATTTTTNKNELTDPIFRKYQRERFGKVSYLPIQI